MEFPEKAVTHNRRMNRLERLAAQLGAEELLAASPDATELLADATAKVREAVAVERAHRERTYSEFIHTMNPNL